jgi:hypothetical protein
VPTNFCVPTNFLDFRSGPFLWGRYVGEFVVASGARGAQKCHKNAAKCLCRGLVGTTFGPHVGSRARLVGTPRVGRPVCPLICGSQGASWAGAWAGFPPASTENIHIYPPPCLALCQAEGVSNLQWLLLRLKPCCSMPFRAGQGTR